MMNERMDEMARTVAARTTRRSTIAGLGALAIGALGIVGIGQGAAAAKNPCQECKQQCKRNNKKPGKKHPTKCSKKCNDKCKNS
jgi:hypothetical protein